MEQQQRRKDTVHFDQGEASTDYRSPEAQANRGSDSDSGSGMNSMTEQEYVRAGDGAPLLEVDATSQGSRLTRDSLAMRRRTATGPDEARRSRTNTGTGKSSIGSRSHSGRSLGRREVSELSAGEALGIGNVYSRPSLTSSSGSESSDPAIDPAGTKSMQRKTQGHYPTTEMDARHPRSYINSSSNRTSSPIMAPAGRQLGSIERSRLHVALSKKARGEERDGEGNRTPSDEVAARHPTTPARYQQLQAVPLPPADTPTSVLAAAAAAAATSALSGSGSRVAIGPSGTRTGSERQGKSHVHARGRSGYRKRLMDSPLQRSARPGHTGGTRNRNQNQSGEEGVLDNKGTWSTVGGGRGWLNPLPGLSSVLAAARQALSGTSGDAAGGGDRVDASNSELDGKWVHSDIRVLDSSQPEAEVECKSGMATLGQRRRSGGHLSPLGANARAVL